MDISIVHGDACELDADVLVLTYPQSLYGVGEGVVERLAAAGEAVRDRLPRPGGVRLIDAHGRLGSRAVLFVGAVAVRGFGYEAIRESAHRALTSLASRLPAASRVAFTLHGADYGLDATEALRSALAGLLDAVESGDYPHELRQLIIVERHGGLVRQLQQQLKELLPSGLSKFVPSEDDGNECSAIRPELLRRAGTSRERAFFAEPPRTDKEFHFLLRGAGARGARMAAHSRARLVFQYDVPPPEVLQRIANAALEQAREGRDDLRLELTAHGNLTLPGKRSDVAHFRNGLLIEPLDFDIAASAPDDRDSGIHVEFVAKGQTIHQIEMTIPIVPANYCAVSQAQAALAGSVPLSIIDDARAAPPPPANRIRIALSLEAGIFIIDVSHALNGEPEWGHRASVPELDAATLASRLLEALGKLENCYQSDAWNGYAGTPSALSGSMESALEDTLSCAAEAGSLLYEGLRHYDGIKPILEYIERMPDGTLITIGTREIFLPWELLYPDNWSPDLSDEQKTEHPLNAARFWGARFAIETEPLNGRPLSERCKAHLRTPPRISVNLNPTIRMVGLDDDKQPLQVHRDWAADLARQGLLDGELHDQCKIMKGVMQNGNHQASLIYVYCHGSASTPFGGDSELLVLNEDEGCKVTPQVVEMDHSPPYPTSPIVFLNACKTGAYSPLAYSNFLRAFQSRGAIGLIATTHSVPATFAAHFGPEVVKSYLNCSGSLATSLYALRHKYLTRTPPNPVPLFYTLQCPLTFPKPSQTGGTP